MREYQELKVISCSRKKCQNIKKNSDNKNSGKINIALLIIFSALLIFITSFRTKAYAENPSDKIKMYKSVVIYLGDNYDILADKYMSAEYASKKTFIKEVKEINHLYDDKLIVGNHIIIPYY